MSFWYTFTIYDQKILYLYILIMTKASAADYSDMAIYVAI